MCNTEYKHKVLKISVQREAPFSDSASQDTFLFGFHSLNVDPITPCRCAICCIDYVEGYHVAMVK